MTPSAQLFNIVLEVLSNTVKAKNKIKKQTKNQNLKQQQQQKETRGKCIQIGKTEIAQFFSDNMIIYTENAENAIFFQIT